MKIKILTTLILQIPILILFSQQAKAVCPICTVAVVAGLGLSRYLKVDDTISGLWIAGIIISSSFWASNLIWKGKSAGYKKIILTAAFYFIFLLPLWLTGIIGHPFNTFLGVDKLIFGITTGSIIFLFSLWADNLIREKIGKRLFAYQKVIFPVSCLLISSIIFYLLTK